MTHRTWSLCSRLPSLLPSYYVLTESTGSRTKRNSSFWTECNNFQVSGANGHNMQQEGLACREAPQEPTATWTGGRGALVLWADTVIKASKRSLITINVLRHTAAEWLQAQTKWIETSSLNHIHHRAKTLARNSCVPLRLPYYPPHCQRCSGEDRRQMNLV